MRSEEFIDGGLQLGHAGGHAAANSPVRDVTKNSREDVEPLRDRGCEVHLEVGMLGQPCLNLGAATHRHLDLRHSARTASAHPAPGRTAGDAPQAQHR